MEVRKFFLLLLMVGYTFHGFSQIQIDTSKNVSFLVEKILLGQGVWVGNIAYQGPSFSIASFNDSSETLGIGKGIIISSGNVFYSKGPNRSTFKGWASGTLGDEDLDQLTAGVTFDAAVLEFDFVTTSENLSFQYVFGSEEYQEYVGSQYNDVFAFFIDGPELNRVNLARLPETNIPITINNVNHKLNSGYYIDNDYKNNLEPFIWDERNKKVVENKLFGKKTKLPQYNTQFDGFTKVLTAKCKVIPGEIYRIKIAIADVADGILDSGVFLKAGSFRSEGEKLVKIDDPFEQKKVADLHFLNKKSLPAPKEDSAFSVIKRFVHFDFDSYFTKKEYLNVISDIYQVYHQSGNLIIKLAAHTDSIGSQAYNMILSKKRAESVFEHLVKLGIDQNDIFTTCYGETRPIDTNKTALGRAKNRRVELILSDKKGYTTNSDHHTSATNPNNVKVPAVYE